MSEDKQDAPEPKKSVSLDLSGLGSLSLGPSWSAGDVPAPKIPKERGEREGGRGGDRSHPSDRRDRRPPREGSQGGHGGRGERREGGREGGRPERRDGGHRERRAGPPMEEVFNPIVEVDFYPEDNPFKVLTNAIKQSYRTFELFEIARLILDKPERFVCVAKHPLQKEGEPARLWASVPDGLPFATETEAVNHVMKHHLETFFDVEEREVDPPAGNFQMIHRCGYTNELLAPPNYHRFQAICQEHHASRLAHISFERFQRRIESVREPEAINEWLEKMKKRLHYSLKTEGSAEKAGKAEIPTEAPVEGAESAEGEERAEAETEPKAVKEGGKVLDSLEAARFYLLTHAKEKLVRPAYSARFCGKDVLLLPESDPIRRSIEVLHEQQMKFPLDTANHLRGRLRRLNFAVYKKGSKGVSFVCAVKRRFRQPDEKFADNLTELIEFVEAHPNIQAKMLPREFLGVEMREDTDLKTLSAEDQAKVAELRKDLKYLVSTGYIIEYSDGRLFLPPPRSEGGGDDDDSKDDAPAPKSKAKAKKPAAPVAPAPSPSPVAAVEAAPVAEEAPAPATEAIPSEEESPKAEEDPAPLPSHDPAPSPSPVAAVEAAPVAEEAPAPATEVIPSEEESPKAEDDPAPEPTPEAPPLKEEAVEPESEPEPEVAPKADAPSPEEPAKTEPLPEAGPEKKADT